MVGVGTVVEEKGPNDFVALLTGELIQWGDVFRKKCVTDRTLKVLVYPSSALKRVLRGHRK